MTSATLALVLVDTLLLIVIALSQIDIATKVTLLRNTLLPFVSSLSRFINPEKK